ncbi:MAG: hypothetical protein RR898_00810 [Clostridium sp.]|uniref:hypothetical protein n=1 Tax=Clostridium sp. TaxID=1506 RepID=UPI002FC89C5C
MLSIIGSAMIILSTTLVGFYYARGFSYRVKIIRDFQYALTMLQSEILYSSSPLIEALDYVGEKTDGNVGRFFKEFSKSLYKREIEGIQEGFTLTMNTYKKPLMLEGDEIDTISSFLKSLESSDSESQKTSFNITMKKFEAFEKRAEEIMNKNEKLYKYLGICSGLLVVIVLI